MVLPAPRSEPVRKDSGRWNSGQARYSAAVSLLHGRRTPISIHEIRPRARQVAEEAQHVGVVRERALGLAAEYTPLGGEDGLGEALDSDLRFQGDLQAELAYCITLAALRFGSGYHAKLAKREGLSVGQTLVQGLTEQFERFGPPSPDELQRVSSADCARWFGQDPDEPAHVELLDLFARSLRDLGTLLSEEHGGSFEALIAAAGGSAARLVELLAEMPFFADVQRYRGLEVPFFLRAQQLVVDLVQTFGREDYGAFTDLGVLAPSGDNVIPHVLRLDGVLQYDRGLAERIDRGEPVPAHTEREVELRAAAVHAVSLIADEVRSGGAPDTTDAQVDAWLRLRGRAPAYREKPRHRSRTVLY